MRMVVIFLLGFFLLIAPAAASEEISYSRAVDLIKAKDINTAYLTKNNRADLETDQGNFVVYYPEGSRFSEKLDKSGTDVWFSEKKSSVNAPGWMSYVPGLSFIYEFSADIITSANINIIILLGLLGIFLIFLFLVVLPRKRKEKVKAALPVNAPLSPTGGLASFADVSGIDEVVEEVAECAEFLKDPEPFLKMGAKMPSGIILFGRPGSGKTLLARAVAGEADVRFFNVSGASFAEKYVGVGQQKVRDLFTKARKEEGGAVIFIDEIDALANKRSESQHGDAASQERESTLNELLVQMDGFQPNDSILVIGATNRVDRLDPAVLRPGRFARQIEVPLPSESGRLQILEMYAKNKPLAEKVDLAHLSEMTSGLSGADLADILNEAAILAARRKVSEIESEDIEEACLKKIAGLKKKENSVSEKERKTIAYHEAGHAIASELCPSHPKIKKLTIDPRNSGAGGLAFYGQKDQSLYYGDDIHQRLIVLLSGRAAEEIKFGRVSSGASSDLEQAEKIAQQAIKSFGLSSKGQIKMSEKNINIEVEEAIERAYVQAIFILRENQKNLDLLAELLLRENEIDHDALRSSINLNQIDFKKLSHSFKPKKSLRLILRLKDKLNLRKN